MTSGDADAFFDACVREIEAEYARLQHSLGWRFLGVSKRVLRGPARLAVVSLNPAGRFEPPGHPRESVEAGSWYTAESWGGCPPGESRLQRQVRLLFRELAVRTGFSGDPDDLIGESLVANVVPFRSPVMTALPRRQESFAFAQQLWAKVLPRVRPRLIVCLGRDAQRTLNAVLCESLGQACRESQALPTGWGTYTATLEDFDMGNARIRLLTLPHLSRFSLFTSERCRESVEKIMGAACDRL